jgi:hypothetical protein
MFICDPQHGHCNLCGLFANRWKALQMHRLPLINPAFAQLGFKIAQPLHWRGPLSAGECRPQALDDSE